MKLTSSIQRGSAVASMRPPEFTGGNGAIMKLQAPFSHRCFNEAAGIHRRKLNQSAAGGDGGSASMRPPEFTGGNILLTRSFSVAVPWLQ